ncbi:hypothetical protein [Arthrobacter sp. A2-55]|uniref:hypothetical protein n=1 Tax=Arthrobacter sp. A2-55 TaxID=2897337 RepID=UPI0021CDD2FC|nr:hypothetical protein [Arthrobacter sp. A2-55]MCU6480174.1 hypothetical protein [Arthrobacter sp. A2-55]
MSTPAFLENDHPRGAAGKFTNKVQSEPSVALRPDASQRIESVLEHLRSEIDPQDISYAAEAVRRESQSSETVAQVLSDCDRLYGHSERGQADATESYSWRLLQLHERRARAADPNRPITSVLDCRDVLYALTDRAHAAGQSVGPSGVTLNATARCSTPDYLAEIQVSADGELARSVNGRRVQAFDGTQRKALAMEKWVDSEREAMARISDAMGRGIRP